MRMPGLAGAVLLAVLLPAGAAAQGTFEGVITYRGGGGGGGVDRTVWVKNGLMRVELVGARSGTGTMIRDAQRRLLALVDSRRMYMVMSTSTRGVLSLPTLVPTGRKETVAGYPCEYYVARDGEGAQKGEQACVTTALGFMPMGPAGPLAPADDRALHAQFRSGFVILKVVARDGRVISEATKVERRSVPDSEFELPPGYTELRLPFAGGRPSS